MTPNFNNSPTRHRCDGKSRRDFLHLGVLSCLGLSLTDLFRLRAAQAANATGRPAKDVSCILIWLDGGPSHLDTFDPKPDAPVEVRGDFKPIDTAVARHPHLRAPSPHRQGDGRRRPGPLAHARAGQPRHRQPLPAHRPPPHAGHGVPEPRQRRRPRDGPLPAACRPTSRFPSAVEAAGPGYLPAAYSPFSVGGDPSPRRLPRARPRRRPKASPSTASSSGATMLQTIDGFSRHVEQAPATASRDAFYEQAYRLMTSPEAKEAFDLSREPDAVARPLRPRAARRRVPAGPPAGRGGLAIRHGRRRAAGTRTTRSSRHCPTRCSPAAASSPRWTAPTPPC